MDWLAKRIDAAPKPLTRSIHLHAGERVCSGHVSDNVHEFAVELTHEGQTVTRVETRTIRFPWTTCPAADARLRSLVGMPIAGSTSGQVNQFEQCTHLLDIARLALAQAARGGVRHYDISVNAADALDCAVARLSRDGKPLLEWLTHGDKILSPGPFHGQRVSGRSQFARALASDPDLREAALILRRSLLIFRGRFYAGPGVLRADQLPFLAGSCMTFQPELIDRAERPADFQDYVTPPRAGEIAEVVLR